MSDTKKSRNHPKSLTTKQRRTVEMLVERFGTEHTSVKRGNLKAACKELIGTVVAPSWITRNMNVRSTVKRGLYDLSVLMVLPVIDPVVEPKPVKAAKVPKEKKEKAPKVAKEKKAKKVREVPFADDSAVEAEEPEEVEV